MSRVVAVSVYSAFLRRVCVLRIFRATVRGVSHLPYWHVGAGVGRVTAGVFLNSTQGSGGMLQQSQGVRELGGVGSGEISVKI